MGQVAGMRGDSSEAGGLLGGPFGSKGDGTGWRGQSGLRQMDKGLSRPMGALGVDWPYGDVPDGAAALLEDQAVGRGCSVWL